MRWSHSGGVAVAALLHLTLPHTAHAQVEDEAPTEIAALDSCRGYAASNVVESRSGIEADLDLIGKGCAVYGPDVARLKLTVEYQTDSRLRVLIQDRDELRYQIPDLVLSQPSADAAVAASDNPLTFKFEKKPFSFQVVKKNSGEVLFDTSKAALIFERQFLRLRTRLPKDPNLYGLGEHTDPFRLYTKRYTRTFWARDSGRVPHHQNLYGNHPIYFEHRTTGTHGVFLRTSNGMDVVLDEDSDGHNYLEYRPIGGVLDLYFLAGPGPLDVSKQYAALVGTPAMVPYWSLGFHQCRFGYQYWFDVAEVVHNYSVAEIPLETIWTDIDYLDRRRVFSVDRDRFPVDKMLALIQYLRSRAQHYIVMVDPAVAQADYPAYNRGMDMDVFLKMENNTLFRGAVWPGVTVYPDWFHPNASAYWTERFKETFNPVDGIDIDGVWIDMNEPANFCSFPCADPEGTARRRHLPPPSPPQRDAPRKVPGFPDTATWRSWFPWLWRREITSQVPLTNPLGSPPLEQFEIDHDGDDLLNPPYRIHNNEGTGALSDLTARTDIQHANGLWEYDVHNLYGTLMSKTTREAMLARRPGLRPFIITRSTFAGAGSYVGKWLGDNAAVWDHYRMSIAGMLGFASIYQVPMVGSDVCGFLGGTTEKLCARWATLGAFNPFFRNHNDHGAPSQEFYRWSSVTKAAKYAISVRYRLLDYFYTALMRQSVDGTPSLNPLWYLYPEDKETFPIDLQFFYGDCLLVSPVTEKDATDVQVYLPDDVFYDFETLEEIGVRGSWAHLKDVPFDRIPLYVRGGCVIPLRSESANTTTELRNKGFELLVAPGKDGTAHGTLYVDDGESLDGGPDRTWVTFSYESGELTSTIEDGAKDLAASGIRVEKVTVMGRDMGKIGQGEDVREEL